jgi:hypothetical protein
MNPTIDKYKTNKEDGPAIENADGSKEWYLNGVRHRTDGPAIEYANGSKEWYLNGVLHRTDGPAIEWADEDKEWYKSWYLNGTELTKDLHMKLTLGPVKKLPLYLGMGFDLFISERLQHESGH